MHQYSVLRVVHLQSGRHGSTTFAVEGLAVPGELRHLHPALPHAAEDRLRLDSRNGTERPEPRGPHRPTMSSGRCLCGCTREE